MRSNNHAFVNELLVYTLFTICFSGSIGLGTVWMRHQISLTANATRELETKLTALKRHLAERDTEIETQQDPALLKQRNIELRLGLLAPTADHIVSVKDDTGSYLARKNQRGLNGDTALPLDLPENLKPSRSPAALSPMAGLSTTKLRLAIGN